MSASTTVASLVVLAVLVPSAALAGAAATSGAGSPLDIMRPSAPTPAKKDWVQLKSGEWLRGDLKRMRDGSLEFESDELDSLSIDWDDVIEVRSPRAHTYVFEINRERVSVTGVARVDRKTVFIRTGEAIQEYPRSELAAILRGQSRRDYWSGSVSIGLTINTGNTDQVDFSSTAWLRRETDTTRVRVDYNGTFGSVRGVTSSNNHRAVVSYDYFLTRRLYLTPLRFEYYTDEFQNLAYRLSPSVGVGYKLMRRGSIEWDVDVGGGLQHTRFDSVESGSEISQGGSLVFGTRFESDITKRTDIKLSYKLDLALSKNAQTTHHAQMILSVDLYKALDLNVNVTWDRTSDPPAASETMEFEENDVRLALGFALDF